VKKKIETHSSKFDDYPRHEHSPMMDHYITCIRLPICNGWTKIVPSTSNVEVAVCNLNDV
jgi:hypothetical protein